MVLLEVGRLEVLLMVMVHLTLLKRVSIPMRGELEVQVPFEVVTRNNSPFQGVVVSPVSISINVEVTLRIDRSSEDPSCSTSFLKIQLDELLTENRSGAEREVEVDLVQGEVEVVELSVYMSVL
jgi:hypothetical protein